VLAAEQSSMHSGLFAVVEEAYMELVHFAKKLQFVLSWAETHCCDLQGTHLSHHLQILGTYIQCLDPYKSLQQQSQLTEEQPIEQERYHELLTCLQIQSKQSGGIETIDNADKTAVEKETTASVDAE
jgi:hypothetical protein